MDYEALPKTGALPGGETAFDRETFERVWRRVCPADRPDCPITLTPPAAAGEAPAPGPSSSVPSVSEPSVPGSSAPAEDAVPLPGALTETPLCVPDNDVPCLGAASAVHGALLQRCIAAELSDHRAYLALSRRAPASCARALAAMAADERRHAKRLSAAYFLISGVRYFPADRVPAPAFSSFTAALRRRFADEQRGASAYLAAGDETADPCLRALFQELAGEEAAHARLIRALLENL